MLEYQPGPPGQWVEIGTLQMERYYSAVVSIGTEVLPCLAGGTFLPLPSHLLAFAILVMLIRMILRDHVFNHGLHSFIPSLAKSSFTDNIFFQVECPEDKSEAFFLLRTMFNMLLL